MTQRINCKRTDKPKKQTTSSSTSTAIPAPSLKRNITPNSATSKNRNITPSSTGSSKFKPSQLVMSLRSNKKSSSERDPADYVEKILDRATRGANNSPHDDLLSTSGLGKSFLNIMDSRPRMKGTLMVCDAGTQTTEVWDQNNFSIVDGVSMISVSNPPDLSKELIHANWAAGSLLDQSRPIGIDPDKMIIPVSTAQAPSSPESNASNVFRADPPIGCVKPKPLRLTMTSQTTPVSERVFSCGGSEDGTSTSSASSYSTLPSSISSPDGVRIANISNNHDKSAFIWSAQTPFGIRY